MASALVGLIAFAVIFGGALVGLGAARVLPSNHLDTDTRNAVSLAAAIIGTLAALVIGLLISTASRSFSDRADGVAELSADLIRADRALTRLGPDASEARARLHAYSAAKLRELFPRAGEPPVSNAETLALIEAAEDSILDVAPKTPREVFLREQALGLVGSVISARWKLFLEDRSSIPAPFLVMLIFWLAVVFASFGLFAPRNGTAIAALALSSLGVAGGLVMILEFDTPFSSLLRISPEPLRRALTLIGG